MGTQPTVSKDISDFKNNDRIGVYRQFEENNRNMIEITKQLPSQSIYKEWARALEVIKSRRQYSQSIYLPQKYHFEVKGMCGSSGTLHIFFERWESFLKDQVASRRKNQHFYTEEELWFILYSLAKIGMLYQPMRSKVGDLHPNNIIVTSEGFLKAVTKHSIPMQPTNFDKIVEEINSDVYLAPEEMDQSMIQSGNYELKYPEKADTFSLGMTMLEVATLQNCAYLYIRNPLRLSIDKFSIYKKIMNDKYSVNFNKIIQAALEIDYRYRISMSQIYDNLKPFAESIQELRPFTFPGSDKKMEEQHSLSMMPEGSNLQKSKRNRFSNIPSSQQTVITFNKPF